MRKLTPSFQFGDPMIELPLLDVGEPKAGMLTPGNYTAIERGANGTTGVGLLEAYRLD